MPQLLVLTGTIQLTGSDSNTPYCAQSGLPVLSGELDNPDELYYEEFIEVVGGSTVDPPVSSTVTISDGDVTITGSFIPMLPNLSENTSTATYDCTLPPQTISSIATTTAAGSGSKTWEYSIPSGVDLVIVRRTVIAHSGTVGADCTALPCVADFNGDGGVTIEDLIDFMTAYENGDLSADINGDGGVTIEDLIAFLEHFEAGC